MSISRNPGSEIAQPTSALDSKSLSEPEAILTPSLPWILDFGHCIDCQKDVPLGKNGRCECGCLGIPPSYAERLNFLTPALWSVATPERRARAQTPRLFKPEGQRHTSRRPILEDGTVQWSRYFKECQDCATRKRPHSVRGYCVDCAPRRRRSGLPV